MISPRATYRLQLGPDLGFSRVRELVGYLDRLGISHLYLSPIWKARSTSVHNYDVVDPTRLDPRLGDETAFEGLADAVASRGMGIVCDIVPNHMAASHENPWWWDVLTRGPASPYADLFDIDWDRGGGKVILPILGSPDDEPWIDGDARRYHEHVLPVDDAHYRTVDWRTGEKLINYRRFFDITDLVATKMDDPAWIDETHRLVFALADRGLVSGLRVDHVDGLRDPTGYLMHIRARLPSGCFVLVEKILARTEPLPDEWPVSGTTGYEHADATESAMVDRRGAAKLRRIAREVTGRPHRFAAVARRSKEEVLTTLFVPEVDALATRLASATGFDVEPLRRAVVEATVALGVYRTYVTDEVSVRDRERIERATAAVNDRRVGRALFDLITSDPDLVASWQQLCAPAEAKGVEDTALYRHVAFVSRNEVGGHPGCPATDVDALHRFNAARAERWPGSMNASSTHDSKRSEDVRARIDVLSEIPDEWAEHVHRWRAVNSAGEPPDPASELLLYQTLVGTWPISAERAAAYMRKAAREAKVHTDWRRIDPEYEDALERFLSFVFENEQFLSDLGSFARRVALHGAANSLARLVLKICAPGFGDLYQGTELWHLHLVDPDNRSPVNFEKRVEALDAIVDLPADELVRTWETGRVKLFVAVTALATRRADPQLFSEGDYLPVAASGCYSHNVIAFARRAGSRWVLAVVPRLTTRLPEAFARGESWGDTVLDLPGDAPSRWTNAFTGDVTQSVRVADVLRRFPVGILTSST